MRSTSRRGYRTENMVPSVLSRSVPRCSHCQTSVTLALAPGVVLVCFVSVSISLPASLSLHAAPIPGQTARPPTSRSIDGPFFRTFPSLSAMAPLSQVQVPLKNNMCFCLAWAFVLAVDLRVFRMQPSLRPVF